MKNLSLAAALCAASLFLLPLAGEAMSNAEIIRTAMTQVFANRDTSYVPKVWDEHYVQHNPTLANGTGWLKSFSFPANFKYEPGFVVAQGDFVMMRGRYTGVGPKPMVAADIFRMKGGKVVEHWDMFQDEVPQSQTKSGNAMFVPDEQGPSGSNDAAADNAAIVKRAMHDVFEKRDLSVVNTYWDEHYVQHNPSLANGTAPLLALLQQFPPNFKFEPGITFAQGDMVVMHGRYTGIARTPMIVTDIFRLRDRKIVEHWDIMQPETPALETRSGNPMFSPGER